jgi:hypothetical protein
MLGNRIERCRRCDKVPESDREARNRSPVAASAARRFEAADITLAAADSPAHASIRARGHLVGNTATQAYAPRPG